MEKDGHVFLMPMDPLLLPVTHYISLFTYFHYIKLEINDNYNRSLPDTQLSKEWTGGHML